MDTCTSDRQLEISWGDQRATVVEVGGGNRRYKIGDRPVLDPYPIDTMCDGGHGAPLIPWPNRLADGQYRFDDEHQLPTGTEPIDGTTYDFRESRPLGATTLDFACTDLVRDGDDRAWARVGGTDGRRAELWLDESYRVIELDTGDTLAAFGHHQVVDAVTVATADSYITTRDLTGFCESADGTHMSEKGRSCRCDRRS